MIAPSDTSFMGNQDFPTNIYMVNGLQSKNNRPIV